MILSLIEKLKNRLQMVRYGASTPSEFLLECIDFAVRITTGTKSKFSARHTARRRVAEVLKGDIYCLKDIKLPLLNKNDEVSLFHMVYLDTFYSYLFLDDKYDEKTVDMCDSFMSEGLYGLQNDKVDVTVESGDIVIDAGAWIGDFAAYASVKGATTYAFEPVDATFNYLVKTAALNKNIIPVKKGLSDKNIQSEIIINNTSSETNRISKNDVNKKIEEIQTIESVTLDDFVKENNLERVDFIKSDIEGYERYMLEGAQETLRKFAPKLALCTYHLPDDPEVMAGLIKKANPDYNIVQKKHKLYASVPKK